MSSTVLSTKVLSASQRSLLLNAGLPFVAYNAIAIEFMNFQLPAETYESIVFTSQNGVAAFLEQYNTAVILEKQIFCVGTKTRSLLEKNGLKIKEMADNAVDLGQILINKHKNGSFLLISGNMNLPALPRILKKNNVRYKTVKVYKTIFNPRRFERKFEGILFFSPSGVQSFVRENKINGTIFCIGPTTAKEVKNYTDSIIIANKPTVENVIVQAVKYFNSLTSENNKSQIII